MGKPPRVAIGIDDFRKLREAELRVEKLSLDRAGEPKLEPLDKP